MECHAVCQMLSKPVTLSQFPSQSFIIWIWKIGGSLQSVWQQRPCTCPTPNCLKHTWKRKMEESLFPLPASLSSKLERESPFPGPRCAQVREPLSPTQQMPCINYWKTHSTLWAPPTSSLYHGQGSSSYGLMGTSGVQHFHPLVSSLKLATVGLFTPWKLVNTTNQNFFFFFWRAALKHLTTHHCCRVMR